MRLNQCQQIGLRLLCERWYKTVQRVACGSCWCFRAERSPKALGWALEMGKEQMCRWVWTGINSWPVLSADIAGWPSDSRLVHWAQEMKALLLQVQVCLCQALLQLGLMLAFFDFWGSISVTWMTSIDCSASAGKTCLPQVLGVAGSEGAAGMGGYSKRYSCPEHPGKFCFLFPCLCNSRGQWSFTEPICSITAACEWQYSTPDRNIISNIQDDSMNFMIFYRIRSNAYGLLKKSNKDKILIDTGPRKGKHQM